MNAEKDDWQPCLQATGVGSLPHAGVQQACDLILRSLPRTPFWPQLAHHSILESMNLQVSPGLPFLRVDEEKGEVRFDPPRDEARELEKAYSAYLAGDAAAYAIPAAYAGGLEGMIRRIGEEKRHLEFFKGQMVGPVTFGLSVHDGEGKEIIHNEMVYDALCKALILRGRWLIERMKALSPRVILFLDEPGLSGYGSAFFSVDAAAITRLLNEAIEDFQARGARVGIHCCGNTDWSLLMETKIDILNFDAWGFFERLALYPQALKGFLGRGGILAWGIVPTSEFTGRETADGLAARLEDGFAQLVRQEISPGLLRERSLLTSSCGMGLMPVALAERATELLGELSRRMQEKYF